MLYLYSRMSLEDIENNGKSLLRFQKFIGLLGFHLILKILHLTFALDIWGLIPFV